MMIWEGSTEILSDVDEDDLQLHFKSQTHLFMTHSITRATWLKREGFDWLKVFEAQERYEDNTYMININLNILNDHSLIRKDKCCTIKTLNSEEFKDLLERFKSGVLPSDGDFSKDVQVSDTGHSRTGVIKLVRAETQAHLL